MSELTGTSVDVSKRLQKPVQLAPWSSTLLGGFDWCSLGDDPLGEMRLFAGATSLEELQQRLDAQISEEVQALLATTQGFDAFDVIELLRLRELPIVPVVALMGGYDGNGAAIELVSLVLLTRDSRMPSGKQGQKTQPHLVIPELHERATRLLRLATYSRSAQAAVAHQDPLARLASEYQSYLVSVRALQYDSVQSEHDRALFDRPAVDELLVAKLGFTYRDYFEVRLAIQERYSRILTSLRDVTGDVVMRTEAEGRELTNEEVETFREAMLSFMFLPAQRAAFTASQIADEANLDLSRVEAVLSAFSMGFDGGRDAERTVRDFLRGVNPLAKTSLVRDAGSNYLMTGIQIGTDSFRMLAESALKTDAKAWKRYDRIRAEVSEALAVGAVERLVQTPVTHTNLKYFAPKAETEVGDLDVACTTPHEVGDQAECDALFIVEDVAICLEVKGRTIAEPARRGDTARLKREIGGTFGGGARQARRLEALIQTNRGVWLEAGSWLDLSGIREVRSIVVGLDFFGPLAVALGDLDRSGLLATGSLPWVASLHDLEVISKVIDRPAEFLLYLRRRTDSGVATHYRGADELDLFMLFLEGGLYVESDPDEIRRQHPNAPPPRNRDRRRHQEDARATIVGTHTDPLDAWMYWLEGTSPYEVDRPTFNTHESARRIVDFLADGRKPGWFRFGADLLGLEGRAQKKLGDHLRELVQQTRHDNRWHSLVQGYAGLWGYPTFFAGTKPRSHSRAEAVGKLRSYMAAKKHQVESDRSLGLLLNLEHEIVQVIYMNDPPQEDPELDDLGAAIGLDPAGQSRRPIPPSAERQTRRLRGRKTRRPS